MPVFEFVLILLGAVLLSNIINRFLPVLSIPIVQIILGIIITLIPFGAFELDFVIEPELFFVLFIAPLVFQTSLEADKKTLWEMKGSIISSAVILVIITIIIGGYIVHAVIPHIPLAAAFALIASLGPTDVVAVDAVAKRLAVPSKIMGILSGESIINDASGIVGFQFAIAAMVTGYFSITHAFGQFLLMGLGGVFVGLAMTFLKYELVKGLRSLGMENATFHILIDILTPFIIYLIAEYLSVNGILAVFATGIAHSFLKDKLNPETVKLNIAHESVWAFLSFTFDGLVFVMLGTQLPHILKTISTGEFVINNLQIVGYIFLFMFMIAFIRFMWWIAVIRKKTYYDPEKPIRKIKAGTIYSLAGAHGAVSLVSVMSIPILLADGSAFPDRDLMILIASGIIVLSLLITNFILPLIVEHKLEKTKDESEFYAYAEIIRKTIDGLTSEMTNENRIATEIVIACYARRKRAMRRRSGIHNKSKEEKDLFLQTLQWEKKNTLLMLKEGKVDEISAKHTIEILESRFETLLHGKRIISFRMLIRFAVSILQRRRHNISIEKHSKTSMALMEANSKYVLDKLNELNPEENDAVERMISMYELIAASRRHRPENQILTVHYGEKDPLVLEVAANGFQIERELIQEMFENGDISWETAREMRSNIIMLEARLLED